MKSVSSLLTPNQRDVSMIHDHNAYCCALPGSGKTHTSVELACNLLKSSSNKLLIVTFTRAAAKEIRGRLSNEVEKRLRSDEDRLTKEIEVKLLSKAQKAKAKAQAKAEIEAKISSYKRRVKVATLDSCIVNMAKFILGSRLNLLVGGPYFLTVTRVVNALGIATFEQVEEVLDYYLSAIGHPEYENVEHQRIVECYHSILASHSVPTFDLKSLGKFVVNALIDGNLLPYGFSHLLVDEFQDTTRIQFEWLRQHVLIGGFGLSDVSDTFNMVIGHEGSPLMYKGQMVFSNEAGLLVDNSGKALVDNDQNKMFIVSKSGTPLTLAALKGKDDIPCTLQNLGKIIIRRDKEIINAEMTGFTLSGRQPRNGSSCIIGVGDDDQSIYRFAGGLGYDNFVQVRENLDGKGYKLEKCFRCAPVILSFAESVIVNNGFRVPKKLIAEETDEKAFVSIYDHKDLIEDLIPHLSCSPKDTAILCRTNRLVSEIEIMMVNKDFPRQRISGKNSLFDDPNVLAFVNFLGIILLEQNILELPNVLGWLGEDENVLKLLHQYLSKAKITRISDIDWTLNGLDEVCVATEFIRQSFEHWKELSLGSFDTTKLMDIANDLARFMTSKRAKARVFATVDFINHRLEGNSLTDRVVKILDMSRVVASSSVNIDRSIVTLSTLHSSKGLEFNTVWIVDASEGSIPSRMKNSIIEAKNDIVQHNEDERRLFYVGITRAKRFLNITYNTHMGSFLANSDLSLCKVYDADGTLVDQ